MSHRRTPPALTLCRSWRAFLVLLAILPGIETPAQQQSRPQQPRPTTTRRSMEVDDNLRAREFDLRTMEQLARQRDLAEQAEKRERLRREQVEFRKNLARMRELNDELRNAAAGEAQPDYKRLAATAGEMRKRAAKLRSTLPKTEGDEKRAAPSPAGRADAQPQMLLAQLNALVDRFVINPVIREEKVVEAASTTDARRDLESIIELSEALRRRADELRGNRP